MRLILICFCLLCGLAFGQQTNTSLTPLPLVARTAATVNSADQYGPYWSCAHFVVNVTAYTGGTYTPHIQAKDAASSLYYDLLVGPAISSTGTTVLKICPGVLPASNGAAQDMLPGAWRVQLIGASTPSMTISVDALIGAK